MTLLAMLFVSTNLTFKLFLFKQTYFFVKAIPMGLLQPPFYEDDRPL